jgi:LDH2 family malate/lactate/ureidoglycolate dehydrogenase
MPMSGRYPAEALSRFAAALLEAAGTPPDNAALVAEALVDADIEGLASHGLLQLPMYLERIARGSVDPAAIGEIVVDAGARLTLDAQNGLGHVTAEHACEIAIARAAEHGVAIVAVRNAFHFGAAGRFARRIALAGKIGIVMANTRPMLPAPGGAEAVVGNNPLAIAIPTGGEPIVLDLAMSAGAMGKVRLAASKGEPIPEGWAQTAEGLPTPRRSRSDQGRAPAGGGGERFRSRRDGRSSRRRPVGRRYRRRGPAALWRSRPALWQRQPHHGNRDRRLQAGLRL